MEPRFGYDFSSVRIHTDADAASHASAINARAYTHGTHVAFATGQYAPKSDAGRHLIAHELAHVVQQSGAASTTQRNAIVPEGHETEREAEAAARRVISGGTYSVRQRIGGAQLQRHKDDLVAYSGGQSGTLSVVAAGKLIYVSSAVSGHPGHGENEPSEGPIPTGRYVIHPKITRSTVAKAQGGVCGANAIASGYQAITSTDKTPCDSAHYCNIPCPTAGDATQKCFTPNDCWGSHRIKIEGRQAVVTPAGKKVFRDGFYIHGGNPADAVSSGCVKSLDDGVFAPIRTLTGVKGAVPFCVGKACGAAVSKAQSELVSDIGAALSGAAVGLIEGLMDREE
jgi:hypothetical protein